MDHDDYMPFFLSITDAKTHDSRMSKELILKSGFIVALDRSYVNFSKYQCWTDLGVSFFTRMKDNYLLHCSNFFYQKNCKALFHMNNFEAQVTDHNQNFLR